MIRHLLVIRFSALGDVIMTLHNLYALATQHPDMQITFVSRQQYAVLLTQRPSNLHFFGADLKNRHKGLRGLNRLLRDINYQQFDAVADLHNVLRSRYIDFRLQLNHAQIAILDKQRYAKWQLTRQWRKQLHPLQSVTQLQRATFQSLGLTIKDCNFTYQLSDKPRQGIGIAPFAAHQGKIYPLPLMEQVIELLAKQTKEHIMLFGAGKKEVDILQTWADKYPNVENLAGKYSMNQEIEIMSSLRIMLTMDSANMHLASLAGTRVISIWGATHPYAGFLGHNQNLDDCIQLDLPCRPCSIYGNKRCKFNDLRCLTHITPQQIVEKIQQCL